VNRSLPCVAIALLVEGCSTSKPSDACIAPDSPTIKAIDDWPADPSPLSPGLAPDSSGFLAAPHRPFPALTAPGWSAPSRVRIETITADGDPLRDSLNAFVAALVTSNWWRAVGADYGLPPTAEAIATSAPPLAGNVDDNALADYIARATAAPETTLDPLTIHLVFLPPGVAYKAASGVNCSCAAVAGAHNLAPTKQVVAFVQRCAVPEHAELEWLTRVASHEIIEAATDPAPGSGFLLRSDRAPWDGPVIAALLPPWEHEVADLCGGAAFEGRWTYTQSWSNAQAAAGNSPCVPATTAAPYFAVSTSEDWYEVQPDGSLDIPLVAWSTGPRPDWFLTVDGLYLGDNGFDVSVASSKPQALGSNTYYAVNNADQATLTVRTTGAKPGTYAIIQLRNHSIEPPVSHGSLIGVYVP
jgi:hypothetical protein